MKQFRHLLAGLAVVGLLFTGCKKDIQSESTAPQTEGLSSAQRLQGLNPAVKAKLQGLRAQLPAGSEKRLKRNAAAFLKVHPHYRAQVERALAITPTACDGNTAINQWLSGELADWDDQVIFFALVTGMLDFPTYDALLFENSSANQYFGVNGEHTQRIQKTFKDLKRFWNISSTGIQLVGLHGDMLLDREKIIRIDGILYGSTPEESAFWADLIIDLMNTVPQYRKGDHPIFTFNAFAVNSFAFPPYGIIPNKIIMGDGILAGLSAIGFGDVAPQAILAHEFGHQIQYQLGLFTGEGTPEATRRTELMADAYAAYYLSHARGASMQWKRVSQFLQVFFNIGDCGFTDPGHHGTPTQRMAAANWGYQLANNAQKQGHILTAQQFAALFDAALPSIVSQ
ncbi:MAG TPA: hypothetical protein VHK69_10915 [Chitinophagaceae bacterium]|jgi:hypothetical protein|nr:hypothetical protein [Chitinophagaceae bacterium]